jgi:hypothetical protein
MSLLVRTSTDAGALLVRDTDDPLALAVTESTSALALRVRESTDPLAMRVRGLFSPASLPGLAAWYDASDPATVLTTVSPDVPATNGQTVRRWVDKSGNGYHFNETNITNQPTLQAAGWNGGPCLQSEGVTERLQANVPAATAWTCFFVGRQLGDAESGTLFGRGGNVRAYSRNATGLVWFASQVLGSVTWGATANRNALQIATFVVNSASSASGQYNQAAAVAFDPQDDATTAAILSLFVTSGTAGGNPINSQAREIVYYDRALTAAEIARVQLWLAARNGVTL